MFNEHKKVCVVGKGHIGTILFNALCGRYTTTHYTLPMDQFNEWKKKGNFNFDIVINAAGKTDITKIEQEREAAWASNVTDPLNIFQGLEETCKYVHLSSACLYDGPYNPINGLPFMNGDVLSPACYYTHTKRACDDIIQEGSKKNWTILRPRLVFSHVNVPKNTLVKLLAYPKLLTTPNSWSSASIIINTVIKCIDENVFDNRVVPCYNFGIMTPFEVGTIAARMGLREYPEMLTKEKLNQDVARPKRVDTVVYDKLFEEVMFEKSEDLEEFSTYNCVVAGLESLKRKQ